MPSRRGPILLLTGVIVATVISVALARRLDSLSRAYRELQVMATTLHPGSVVPVFTTTATAGEPVTVGLMAGSAGNQLILLFTTTCPYCQRSLPAWQTIADSVARRGDSAVAVVGISLDSADLTTVYVRQFGIRFDVGFFPDERTKRLFRATKVPETIVVDYDGHVILNHIGVLEPGPAFDSVLTALFSTDTDSSSLVSTLDQR